MDETPVTNTISGGAFFGPVVQARDVTVQLPHSMAPALDGLPATTSTFSGRDADLRGLLSLLAPDGPRTGTVVVSAVAGLAGVGKTELALQAAHTARDRGWFPGGILFVDLQGYDPVRRVEPHNALRGLLQSLGIAAESIPSEAQDRTRLYASVLATAAAQGRRTLIVVDNVSSADQARPLLPTDGTNMAVVTSRHTLGGLDARLLDLDVLTPDDSVDLLDKALGIAHGPTDRRVRDHPSEARTIAALCGCLPLALQIVAALLADDPTRPLHTFVADLADTRSRLDELQRDDVAVRAAFDLSYRHLSSDQAQLFRLLTVNPGPETSTEAAAAITGQTDRPTRRGLEALARGHMIESGNPYGRWRMHDLIHLYAEEHSRTQADIDRRDEALDRLVRYYLDTARRHDRTLSGHVTASGSSARGDALVWLDAERTNLVAAVAHTHALGRWQDTYNLANSLSHYFELRHYVDGWVATHELALDAANHLGPAEVGDAATRLGSAYRVAHRYDNAVGVLQQALQIARRDGTRTLESSALHNLGLAYFQMGDYVKAASCHRKDLKICRDLGDIRGAALTLTALGDAHRALGQFDEADRCLRGSIRILDATEDSDLSGIALGNHGLTRLDQGHPISALLELSTSLKIARDRGDRRGEALATMNIGCAYMTRCPICHRQSAIHWLKMAVTMFHELQDPHGEARALRNLGTAYLQSGDNHHARRYWQKAATVLDQVDATEAEEARAALAELSQDTAGPTECPVPEDGQIRALLKALPYQVLRSEPPGILIVEPSRPSRRSQLP
jgi:tetratricopeptide (TPR) repeat protein